MHIMLVGLNYKTTPVEIREKISVSDLELDDVLAALRHTRTVMESVVLSTCNRTEVYAVVSSARAGEDFLVRFLRERYNETDITEYLYIKSGKAAVTHLMNVACGLDSMIIGETQILGQVRNAFLAAADAGNTGALFNQLFRKTIQVGKRAQSETTIGQSAVSVSYAAVQLARKILGDLKGRRVVVLGAGKMSRLTAQHLYSTGISEICIANRTYEKAVALAEEVNGTAIRWADMEASIVASDIVISSTGSKDYVLDKPFLETVLRRRNRRPMVLVDIAVPRDIDPEIGQLKHVYLYDIDDLQGVVQANLAERERQAEFVESMVSETLREFSEWLSEQEVVPLIAAVRAKGVSIQESVMESLRRKLPNLSEREFELLQKHTMSIVNQILRDPIQNMKELAIASGGAEHVHVFAQLFGVKPDELQVHGGARILLSSDAEGDAFSLDDTTFVDLVKRWGDYFLRSAQDEKSDKGLLHPVLR